MSTELRQVKVYFTELERERLRECAENEGDTLSGTLRRAARRYIRAKQAAAAKAERQNRAALG